MPLTWDEFTAQVVSCGLLRAEELDKAKQELTARGRPANAEELRNLLVRQGLLTGFQASCLWEGKTQWLGFGEYLVLDKIGQGGMGMVLKARHRRMDRLAAIKTLRPQTMREPKAIERFYREVKAAARLNHPNIVTAYDAGEHQGIHYLVMEYVDGEDLARLVKKHGPMGVPEALDCILQAAKGLAYAHQQGVIHRDIKPGNLLLDRAGVVKILDMGLAQLRGLGQDPATGERLTGTGQVMGTCDYMAPEQAVSTHQVDHRADIYSLGCTLYRLLTGKPPYEGETVVEVLMAHRDAPIPSLRAARPEVSEDLDRIFQRMVAKRPEDRFPSMAEVIRALEACLVGAPVGPEEEGSAEDSASSTSSALRAWLAQRAAEEARKGAPYEETETWQPQDAEAGTVPALSPGVGRGDRIPGAPTPPVGRKPTLPLETVPRTGPPARVKPAGGVSAWWARLQQAFPQMPRWGWGLAAALPVVLVVVGVVLVVVFRERTPPVRETARPSQSQQAKGSVPGSLQPGQPSDSQAQPKPAPEGAGGSAGSGQPPGKADLEHPPAMGRVVLHWPQADREDAKLDLDGLFLKIEELVDPKNPDVLRLAVRPGQHTIWLARRGFEPFEQTVTVAAGQEVTIRPEWRKGPLGPGEPPSPPESKPPGPQEPKPEEKPGPKPEEKPPWKPEGPLGRPAIELAWEKLDSQLRQWESQEAQFTQTVAPVEERVKKWQFVQAAAEAPTVRFSDPELQRRWQVRQQQLEWLAEWKQRIIQKIRSADTPPKKMALGIRGLNGDVIEADQEKLTCRLPSQKTETIPWHDLGGQAPQKLAVFGLDPTKPDDLLKAAVFLASVGQAGEAAPYFAQAQQKGLPVQEHLELASYPIVRELVEQLRQKKYSEAQSALQRLEEQPALTSWRNKHQQFLDGIRAVLTAAQRDAEAEKLYAEAVQHYKLKELHDVKPLVEKLRSQYADTTPVLDPARQPSFPELEQATADAHLGRRITVSQDGKGDFRSIQAAIDACRGGELIEILDDGPYNEYLLLPAPKKGLTLRGKRGRWPVLTSLVPKPEKHQAILHIEAPETVVERLVLLKLDQVPGTCLRTTEPASYLANLLLLYAPKGMPAIALAPHFFHTNGEISNSLILGAHSMAPITFTNCVFPWMASLDPVYKPVFRQCTIDVPLEFRDPQAYSVIDCIVLDIRNRHYKLKYRMIDYKIENCVTYGQERLPEGAVNSFSANPMFRDPANLDYRLKPGSPCIGKASDGGDIGCRYTPEMLELVKVALELRRRGVIKF